MGRGREQISPGVTVRKHKNVETIQLSFMFKGVRCREPLALPPTKPNLRFASDKLAEVRMAIAKGIFNYAEHFPNSKRARLFGGVSDVTIASLLAEFQASMEKSAERGAISPSTLDGYKKAVRFMTAAFGALRARDLTPGAIQSWVKAQDLTAKTVNNYLIPLRTILGEALNAGQITSNPLTQLDLKLLLKKHAKPSDYDIQPFEPHEVVAILAAAEGQTRNLFQFAFATGLRTSELIALRWSDVDLARKVVRVRRAYVEGREKGTKTRAGMRDVDLSEAAEAALEAQRQWTQLARGRVFWNPVTGKPLETDQQIRKSLWTPLLKKAGIPYRNPYQTRHTYASALLSAGENPWKVAAQMGHEDTEMVIKNYGRWIPAYAKRSA